PNIVTPIALSSPEAVAAAEIAADADQTVIGVAFKDDSNSEIKLESFHKIGIEIALGRVLRLPDNTQSALGQGRRRVEIAEIRRVNDHYVARAKVLQEITPKSRKVNAALQVVLNLFKRAIELNDNIPGEVLFYALNADQPGWLADLVTSTLTLPFDERQR